MAGSSGAPPCASEERIQYLYASNTNVSNFVSVKLSGDRNYLLWKAQMICLMDTHNICGIVDASFVGLRDPGMEIMRQYDSLLKGWIFGSVTEEVLLHVLNLGSAKDVWEKLKSMYDPTTSLQQDSAPTKSESKAETQDIDAVSAETNTNDKDGISIDIGEDIVLLKTETKGEDTKNKTKGKNKKKLDFENAYEEFINYGYKMLHEATIKGNWLALEPIFKKDKDLATVAINSDGSTVLHIAVGIGHTDFVKNLLSCINDEQVLEKRNSDGSTALHIAAIVGNKYAADLLVKKNKKLLQIEDLKGEEPLHKAYENMHLDTIGYLLKASNDDGKTKFSSSLGVNFLVNAISAKEYNLASGLIEKFPKFASKNDDVLMALAKTFPYGLDFWETLIYPSLDNIWKVICVLAGILLKILLSIPRELNNYFHHEKPTCATLCGRLIADVLLTVPTVLVFVVVFTFLFISIVCFSCLVPYFLLWKGASILGGPIKHIENKNKEWNEATKVLELVCDEIDKLEYSGTHHPFYTQPILEAACQNAYKVVDEILYRSPDAIQSTNKSGYDIIQLAVINRSEKIYNIIYDIGERKNLYRTYVDSSKNNILHLARLAPSHELNRRTGAALQLQRELQWREVHTKLLIINQLSVIFWSSSSIKKFN